MIHPIRRTTTALRALLRRRPTTPDPSSGIANPLPGTPDTDPAATPADGYPHHYYAIPHTLPTGEPNRGDELLWVETEIARHAAAGTLDEGTAHLLDATITARLTEWHHAIDAAANRRRYITEGLHATGLHYLTHTTTLLDQAHTTHHTTTHENTHWRTLLTGHTPTPHPTHTLPPTDTHTHTHAHTQ